MRSFVKLIRPVHWIKNILIFAPAFFGGKLFNKEIMFISSLSFLIFCFISSGIYVMNDIFDVRYDSIDPFKKDRPLVKGEISLRVASFLSVVLVSVGLFFSFKINLSFLIICAIYVMIQILYSLVLKNIVILDVFCVSFGYLLRILAGGEATNINVSGWLFMSTFLLALFISFGKRLAERKRLGEKAIYFRPVLGEYNESFLLIVLGITGSSALITYVIYCVEKQGFLVYTSIFASYGILRYLYLVFKYSIGDPLKIFIKDTQIKIISIIFLLHIGILIYL